MMLSDEDRINIIGFDYILFGIVPEGFEKIEHENGDVELKRTAETDDGVISVEIKGLGRC
jgi:hypothetical protein